MFFNDNNNGKKNRTKQESDSKSPIFEEDKRAHEETDYTAYEKDIFEALGQRTEVYKGITAPYKEERHDVKEAEKRNVLFTSLLYSYSEDYKDKTKLNKRFRMLIIIAALIAFFIFLIFAVVLAAYVVLNLSSSIDKSVTIITATASILAAIIILPQTLLKHLFPIDDKDIKSEVIKEIQKNDAQLLTNTKKEDINKENEEFEI